jgi:hypothetical protein
MNKYELVQHVQKLVEAYNQTHEGHLHINWSNGFYFLNHSNIPTFKYDIGYFNQHGDKHIQDVFNTMTNLIAIYETLNDDFRSHRLHFSDDHFEINNGDHQTILKPLSEQMIAVEQTYRPSLTEISFQKDGVDILLTSDSPYHWIDTFYTAKATVTREELNDTIKALKEKTQNIL